MAGILGNPAQARRARAQFGAYFLCSAGAGATVRRTPGPGADGQPAAAGWSPITPAAMVLLLTGSIRMKLPIARKSS